MAEAGATPAVYDCPCRYFSKRVANRPWQFVEYNSRAHRLETLASFSFWVTSKALVSLTLLYLF